MEATVNNGTTKATGDQTENEKKYGKNSVGLVPLQLEDDITLEDLAPDGGWGWMVALAMIVVLVTTFGPASSFAIIFGDFLEATGQAGTASTLFNSVFMITFSISSFLTNPLLKRYSMRTVGITGAVIFSFPNVALAFVGNVYEMAFIFLLQGIGLGLLVTICNTNFNAYFVKKRAQIMSASQVIIGLGGIVYPICIEKMMTLYGFRGTAALTGALSLNCIVGMTMMHPVEWHSKHPDEVRLERARQADERKRFTAISNRRFTMDFVHTSSRTRSGSFRSLKDEDAKEVPLLVETQKAPANRVASTSGIDSAPRARSMSASARDYLTKRFSALSSSSLGNLVSGASAIRDIKRFKIEEGTKGEAMKVRDDRKHGELEEAKSISLSDTLSDLLEISLVKNRCFINLCLGISFAFTSDFTFATLLPLMMTNSGYKKSDAALAITVSATAELISRILLAIFTLLVDVKAKYLFFFATICMSFAKAGFLFYEDTLTGALVMNVCIGACRSWLLVPQPLVIIEDITIDKFAAAYGIFAMINGVTTILFGPIVGFIKDWTNSFQVCQLALIGMNSLFVIPWGVQFLLVDLPKSRNERRTQRVAAQRNREMLS